MSCLIRWDAVTDDERYRMGDFDRAQDIYDQLLADCDSVCWRTAYMPVPVLMPVIA